MSGQHDEMDEIVRQWIEKAEHDYSAAIRLLSSDDPETPFDVICFHAQQCAEKYLKALCVFRRQTVPRSHDLLELLPILPEAIRLTLSSDEIAELNPFAVEARYPGFSENVARNDAGRAVDICGKIRSACSKYLGINRKAGRK